ncbi:MAG: SUMF1/EgtB/PvdO family nonheme iron enzyme [Akkermansiaceae bacterium]|nr:SUMF1/EgtB/PvdO family nonheme iron enzyme [Akkermansiaceae bacterium]
MPKFHEKKQFPFRKSVNLRKPVDRGTAFTAICSEMGPILPFLPLNPLQPDPKGGERTEGLKKGIPSNNRLGTTLAVAATIAVLAIAAWAMFSRPKEVPKGEMESVSTAKDASKTVTKESPFTNSLGMKFVPVVSYTDGRRVLFNIWETRSKDYAAFVKATGYGATDLWRTDTYNDVPVGRGEGERAEDSNHPAVCVSGQDAAAFCRWLTKEERASGVIGLHDEYRLPSDVEWSYAVGIADKEDDNGSPTDKNMRVSDIYPWGTTHPPPPGSGSYADETAKAKGTVSPPSVYAYNDGYATTAPVGSFQSNTLGIYDLGGNVSEFCQYGYDGNSEELWLRGGSWRLIDSVNLLSSRRTVSTPHYAAHDKGFRCVLVVAGHSSP